MRLVGMASTRWIVGRVFGVVEGEVGEQRVDRGEAVVACRRPVVPIGFEMVQEGGDQWGVEIGDVKGAGRRPGPLGSEAKKQSERDLVGGDGVRAGSPLADQPVGEVGLQGRSQRAHLVVPNRESSRSAAKAISSGAADRYQYVSAGLTWPR